MKHLFIINPAAGKADRTTDIFAVASGVFTKRNEEFEIYVTKAPMDAAVEIRRQAGENEYLRVYSCGGDGTFNECVCGAAGLNNVAVAPFATGTGNDFIRMFGEEKKYFFDMEGLVDGEVYPMDIIECNGRACANIASVGFDARIAADVHKYSRIPLIGGATGYVTSLVVNFIKGISQKMRLSGCGYKNEGEYILVCACNGRYYGGGFNPVPDAVPDDGLMDILVVSNVPRIKAAGLVMKYARGEADKIPAYITHLRGREFDINLDDESVINVDGEAVFGRNIHLELIPNGVNFIVPRGMSFFKKSSQAKLVTES